MPIAINLNTIAQHDPNMNSVVCPVRNHRCLHAQHPFSDTSSGSKTLRRAATSVPDESMRDRGGAELGRL